MKIRGSGLISKLNSHSRLTFTSKRSPNISNTRVKEGLMDPVHDELEDPCLISRTSDLLRVSPLMHYHLHSDREFMRGRL